MIVTSLLMQLLMGRQMWEAYVISSLVPLLVAFPITFYVQTQKARLAQMHKDLQKAHAELKHLSQYDDLTQTYNRSTFYELSRDGAKTGRDAAILMIDVDHFKQINDSYGHSVGDDALRLIVGAIRSAIRESDVIGRIGGEEFCLYCPQTTSEQAHHIAERVRKAVEALRFEPLEDIVHPLTVSIGGSLVDPELDLDKLIQSADHSMYQAKESGRNRVIFGSA
ncbi:MAG: GGDEF domain-containing protein [Cohaesibacter sp.]|nr:GGDEF domain-containing protein [Cohaesibacter sp.]